MRKLTADYIYTGSGLAAGKLIVCNEDGTILTVTDKDAFSEDEVEVFSGILCPGFVNAHCHLELSYMYGKIPEKKGLVQFIRDLLSVRSEKTEIISEEIERANHRMFENGIVAVGDISNDDYTFETKTRSKIYYHTFIESYGYIPADAQKRFNEALRIFKKSKALNLSASITPHAPYSVPPELFQLIFQFDRNNKEIFSIHNQESESETILFKDGSGEFKMLLEETFKIDSAIFHPTGKRSLESVLPYFPKDKRILLVHNTLTNKEDVMKANSYSNNFYWCTCPNANLYIENKLPDYNLMLEEKDKVCIGTDSLASNHQLSVLEEIKTIQQHFPSIGTQALLQWATLNGARFLGVENRFGSFEKGKNPGINLIRNIEKGKLALDSAIQRII